MSTTPTNDPNAKYVPPDPGDRSRILSRCILVACIIGVAVVIVFMVALRNATQPATPKQQQTNQSSLRLPANLR